MPFSTACKLLQNKAYTAVPSTWTGDGLAKRAGVPPGTAGLRLLAWCTDRGRAQIAAAPMVGAVWPSALIALAIPLSTSALTAGRA
jgi:hypothetical protein